MTRLRASVFLSSDPIMPTEAPQPMGREKMPAPLQAALAWNSLLGRMPVSVKVLPCSSTGIDNFGEMLSSPARSDIASCVTYSSGIVSPCMSAA